MPLWFLTESAPSAGRNMGAAPNGCISRTGVPAVPGASIIAEYSEETEGAVRGINSLLPKEPRERVEVRRLADWYNDKFYEEVSGPLVKEREFKRHMTAEPSGVLNQTGGRRPE